MVHRKLQIKRGRSVFELKRIARSATDPPPAFKVQPSAELPLYSAITFESIMPLNFFTTALAAY